MYGISERAAGSGWLVASGAEAVADDFVAATVTHRHFASETDPI